jgi:hypothetical protein
MQTKTAFRLLNDKFFEAKPKQVGFVMLPEIKNLVASLAKKHWYTQSDIIMAAVIMFSDASRNERVKLPVAVANDYDIYDEETPA